MWGEKKPKKLWWSSQNLVMFYVPDPGPGIPGILYILTRNTWYFENPVLEYLVFLIEKKSCSDGEDENCCQEGEAATKCVQ